MDGPHYNAYIMPQGLDNATCLLPYFVNCPHICTFDRLRYIQGLYDNKQISKILFDSWMSYNGASYQLGNSTSCYELWNSIRPSNERTNDDISTLPSCEGTAVNYRQCRLHKSKYCIAVKWNAVTSRSSLKILNKVFKWSSDADKSKTNLDMASLLYHAYLHKQTENIDAILPFISLGYPNVTATFLVIQSLGNPSFTTMLDIMRKNKACCMSIEQYRKFFKSISIAIRRTNTLPNHKICLHDEVNHLAYWEIPTGRSGNITDWADELSIRTTPRWLRRPLSEALPSKETNAEYLIDLRHEVKQVMIELITKAPRQESWADFVRRRQSWISSGSTGGQKIIINGNRIRVNKHTYFENVKEDEMLAWLEQIPSVIGTASEKFELGKARSIYGTGVVDYCIMSYVIWQAEAHMYQVSGLENGVSGLAEIATIARRLSIVQDDRVECTMIDYADFNVQHTLEAQAILFDELAKRYIKVGAHPDYVRASEWCAQALLNQWCKFPHKKEMIKISQGMFSGVRGTNFINTLLNLSYFRTAKTHAQRLFRVSPIGLYNRHNGDDVWLSNMSRLWAICVYLIMQASNFDFQDVKQMFDRARGEYLRVLYSASGAMGYLARAAGTLIIKPLQGEDFNSPSERAVAMNAQIYVSYRRGCLDSAIRIIWDACVPNAATIGIENNRINIPRSILRKSYLDGGLDLGYPKTMAHEAIKTAAIPNLVSGSKEMEAGTASYMSKDWIKVISEQYQDQFNAPEIEASLHKSNMCDSLRSIDKSRSLRTLYEQIVEWKHKLDKHSVIRDNETYDTYISETTECTILTYHLQQLRYCQLSSIDYRTDLPYHQIFSAIAKSPFRDLSTAMRALSASIIRAAEVCIDLCPVGNTQDLARASLRLIINNCGGEVASRILSGVRQGGGIFECDLHPIILSWLQHIALEMAISECVGSNIGNVNVWDLILRKWHRISISQAMRCDVLLSISKY